MLVYRIVLSKYADSLLASGRAARWNSVDTKMIYTSASQSLCCLENIVHRSKLGLAANFSLLVIEIPDNLEMDEVLLSSLPADWRDFSSLYYTQMLGTNWLRSLSTPVLKVPSSIITVEHNFLINPAHPNFSKIRLIDVLPFWFDDRIKD
jgi:RES domain-containing protein